MDNHFYIHSSVHDSLTTIRNEEIFSGSVDFRISRKLQRNMCSCGSNYRTTYVTASNPQPYNSVYPTKVKYVEWFLRI